MRPFEQLNAEEAIKRMSPPPAREILKEAKAIAMEHPSKDARKFAAVVATYLRWNSEVMPQIKPLVWLKGNPQINEWIAETPLGKFRVIKRSHDACAVVYMAPFRSMVSPDLVDVEETKKACEQEYERRVRECLV